VRALTDTNDLPGFASHDDRDTIEIIRDSGSADYDGGLFFSVISPGSMTIVLANFIRTLWLYTYSNINHFLMIKLDTIFLNFFSHNLHKSVVTCQLAPMLRADGRVKYIFLQKRVLMSEMDKYPILINMLASASRNICGRVK
jgi:hypothetical protein